MAASVEFEDDNGQVVRYVRHANGGGLVSPRARVHEAAMVASTAYVEAGAQVGDRCRIGAGSWLDLDVIVGEDVVVAANVHLGPRTRAEDGTWIGTGARVGSDVVIARGARVAPDAVVRDAAVVRRRAGSGRSEFGIAA
jgi:UDP-3-O-[3-hydroxymyristoyl] glucosamine N-acyltransferase